ncbi:MAG: hypothetical protein IJI97_06565 [Clostridia bacterium]|nr:hypothetical protein [Clostridia bacterium]
MDNATNYELNLDKPIEDWTFRVRMTREEVALVHRACETPHEAFLSNPEMVDQIKVLGFRFTRLAQDASHYVMVDLSFRELWAVGGLVQNLAAKLRMDVDHLAESIYFFVRHTTDHARDNA